jgi:hypothetical protein
MIGLAGTIEVHKEPRTHAEPGAIGAAEISNPTEPRPVLADPPID